MGAINAVADLAVEGDIAILTLNSPPVNALSQQVRDGIVKGMKQAIDDSAVKAIVLICEGKTFIAGADITEFGKPPQAPEPLRRRRRDRELAQAGHRRDPRHRARRRPGSRAVLSLSRRRALREVRPARSESRPAARRRRHAAPAAHRRSRAGARHGDLRQARRLRRRRTSAGLIDELVPEGELRAGAIAFAKKVRRREASAEESARPERQGRRRARQAGDVRRLPQGQRAQVPRLPRARIQHPLHRSGGEPAVRRRPRSSSASCSWS